VPLFFNVLTPLLLLPMSVFVSTYFSDQSTGNIQSIAVAWIILAVDRGGLASNWSGSTGWSRARNMVREE
jgi:hypothetical protein